MENSWKIKNALFVHSCRKEKDIILGRQLGSRIQFEQECNQEEQELGVPHNQKRRRSWKTWKGRRSRAQVLSQRSTSRTTTRSTNRSKAEVLQLVVLSQHSRWPPLFSDSGTCLVQALHVHFIMDEFWDFVCVVLKKRRESWRWNEVSHQLRIVTLPQMLRLQLLNSVDSYLAPIQHLNFNLTRFQCISVRVKALNCNLTRSSTLTLIQSTKVRYSVG